MSLSAPSVHEEIEKLRVTVTLSVQHDGHKRSTVSITSDTVTKTNSHPSDGFTAVLEHTSGTGDSGKASVVRRLDFSMIQARRGIVHTGLRAILTREGAVVPERSLDSTQHALCWALRAKATTLPLFLAGKRYPSC